MKVPLGHTYILSAILVYMKIGVFDSGIGGKSIAEKLRHDYPDHEIIYVDDHEHVPYGSRPKEEIIQLTDTAIQPLLRQGCDTIVLACNTATAVAIETLRLTYPSTPFIGLEPMIKPAAALSKTGVTAVFATPATLASDRYNKLKTKYALNTKVIEPDCSQWAYLIEKNEMDSKKIEDVVNEVCDKGADVIVLACTHYHWIKEEITGQAAGKASVIDPSDAISKRVKAVLGL